MKSIITLVLSVALLLGCVTPTFAQDPPAKKSKSGKGGKAPKKKKGDKKG